MSIVALIISAVALVISAGSLLSSILTSFYNKKMKKVILEKDLLDSIKNSRARWSSFAQRLLEMGHLTESQKKIMQKLMNERIEDYLNSLDYACDKYNESLINKKSFNRNFSELVKEASEDKTLFKIVDSDKKNKFKALKEAFRILEA